MSETSTEQYNLFPRQCGCKEKTLSVENADWVIDGVPYCSRACYDKRIDELLLQVPHSESYYFHIEIKCKKENK